MFLEIFHPAPRFDIGARVSRNEKKFSRPLRSLLSTFSLFSLYSLSLSLSLARSLYKDEAS